MIQRRLFVSACLRLGSREFLVQPDVSDDPALRLESRGRSRYWEQEVTLRAAWGESRELITSYVRSSSRADLNAFEQYFGNFRNPIIRANEFGRNNIDIPNRLIVRGAIGLPGKWEIYPIAEVRDGFPFSRVDEQQAFVSARNDGGRFPVVRTVDITIQRPIKIKKFRKRPVWVGLRLFNAFDMFNPRDVQNNVDSASFGGFYNSIDRFVGLVVDLGR